MALAPGSALPAENPAPSEPQDWVWLARILHPQGRKGEVFAGLLTDFPEKFAERKRLWLLGASGAGGGAFAHTTKSSVPRELELIAHWLHKGGIVLHFAGIDSISAAETLKGLTVAIPRAARAALAEDEVYIGDLIGCVLIDVAQAEPVLVGEIEEVDRSVGPVALLVVNGASSEVLIPFAKSYLRSMDLLARRVEMALPEGLIELNAPGKVS
jgi:16S rRNA processing protein RimM